MKAHRDGLPGFSARSARRGDAVHRETCATPSVRALYRAESPGKPPSVAYAARRWASESFDDAPHRLQLPSCPTGRIRDLYGPSSALLGISASRRRVTGTRRRNRVAAGGGEHPPTRQLIGWF